MAQAPGVSRRSSRAPHHPAVQLPCGDAPDIPGLLEFSRSRAAETRDKPFAALILEMLDHVRDAFEEDLPRAQAAAASLLDLLTPTPDPVRQPPIARGGLAPWQKRKIERYLCEHIGSSIYVDQLAGEVCLSVSHFCRAFKESFGSSPHNYIIQMRLELARKLMLTTDEPLSQIALACGFADQAHLTKLFRRWLNESPRAWRRQNLTDAQADAINQQA